MHRILKTKDGTPVAYHNFENKQTKKQKSKTGWIKSMRDVMVLFVILSNCYLLFHNVSLLLIFKRFVQCQKTLWHLKVTIKYNFLMQKSRALRFWSSKNSKYIFNFKKLGGGINETLLGGKDLLQFVAICSSKDWMRSSVTQWKSAWLSGLFGSRPN